jgi:hypothetical protein
MARKKYNVFLNFKWRYFMRIIKLLFILFLPISVISSCISVRGERIDDIKEEYNSSHAEILTSFTDFTVALQKEKDRSSHLMLLEKELGFSVRSILENQGYQYIDPSNAEGIFGQNCLWFFINFGTGDNDYGYYFPEVLISAVQWNSSKLSPDAVWSGKASYRYYSSSVAYTEKKHYNNLIKRILDHFPKN